MALTAPGLAAVALMVLALGLALAGCGTGEDRPGAGGSVSGSVSGISGPAFSKREATGVVRVIEREFSIVAEPPAAKGPKIYFEVVNQGAIRHELEVFDAKGKLRGELHVGKGETKALALELTPGTYRLDCHVKEGNTTHSELGMKAPFTVE